VFLIKNPFAKHRAPSNSRTNTLDAQETGNSGLRRTSTDHFGGRNKQHGLLEFQPPTRRGTAPNASSRIDQSRGFNIDLVRRLPVQEEVPMEFDEKAAKDSQSSETVAVEEEKLAHQHPQDFVPRKPDDKGNGNEAKGDDNNGKEKTTKFTWRNQIQGTIFNSWINILLLFCEPAWLVAVLFLLMPGSTCRNCTLLYSRQPYCRFRR